MTVRSKPLFVGSVAALFTGAVYTVPSGRTAILRRIAASGLGGVGNLQFQLVRGPVNVQFFQASAGATTVDREEYHILGPSDQIAIANPQATAVVLWLSGVELGGVAPA